MNITHWINKIKKDISKYIDGPNRSYLLEMLEVSISQQKKIDLLEKNITDLNVQITNQQREIDKLWKRVKSYGN